MAAASKKKTNSKGKKNNSSIKKNDEKKELNKNNSTENQTSKKKENLEEKIETESTTNKEENTKTKQSKKGNSSTKKSSNKKNNNKSNSEKEVEVKIDEIKTTKTEGKKKSNKKKNTKNTNNKQNQKKETSNNPVKEEINKEDKKEKESKQEKEKTKKQQEKQKDLEQPEDKQKELKKFEKEKQREVKLQAKAKQKELKEQEKIEKNKLKDDTKKEANKAINQESKEQDEKPEYVKEMLKNKKRKMIIIISIITLILVILAFSTFFALFNMNSKLLSKGVMVRDIEVSGLTTDEAKEKINNIINAELMPEIELKYGEDYKITLLPEQVEYKYNVDEAVLEAYKVGREGMIFENNYTLLFTTFFGKNIKIDKRYNEELLNNFIEDISSKIPGLVVEPSYYIEESNLIISKGKDGVKVDKETLKSQILKAIENRNIEEVSKENYNQTIEIPVEAAKASNIDIDKIYTEIYREPQDAYFETDPYKIYADVDGIDFNISVEEAKNIISSEEKEEYEIPLKISKAQKTIDDIGTEAFPYLISKFSTKYDASNTNRSTNLAIAANKINGKVLMPGEVFSFNKVVGKRTVEEGYRDAKIYADGGVVDGLAGGICQISSTLYNTVLLANLEIVERRNHSFPTSYVEVGRDATVVYGAIDFQFKNSRNYPIKFEASVKNGIAEFKIFGMQEETEYEIRILPVTTKSIPYGTSYIDDPTLAPGQQIVTQAGKAGYKVTTYIEKRLNGAVISKEVLSNDTYTPMKSIIRRGPVGAPVPAQ